MCRYGRPSRVLRDLGPAFEGTLRFRGFVAVRCGAVEGTSRSDELLGHPIRSTPALAKILASLEADNLIARTRSDTDRRGVIVEATPDATALWGQVQERISTDVVTPTTHDLSDQDVAALTKLLTSLDP